MAADSANAAPAEGIPSLMQPLAKALDELLEASAGRRMGFLLFVFDFTPGGNLHWVANAERDDTITALFEWIGRQDPERLKQGIDRIKAQRLHGPEMQS